MSLADQLATVSIEISLPHSTVGGGLKTKSEVDYRKADDEQRCDRCDYYTAAKCDLVAGRIWPEGTCDLWEPNAGMEDSPQKYADDE